MNAALEASLEWFDIWQAAEQRSRRASDCYDIVMCEIGRYASSRDPKVRNLVDFTVTSSRRNEADVYETKYAAHEFFELRRELKPSPWAVLGLQTGADR
ncbi:hypothetical protein [Gordonia sp. N1V]|uniref:hypothetical protein n=1 Tax=Gordonia sp. N1V TaxID=3034163 RepID=UPI0023E0C56C|nr:hypothetical protein [Gordonia sp. N1V]MDF3280902.1 hypothetical protein [Gordonia sp. N1V]